MVLDAEQHEALHGPSSAGTLIIPDMLSGIINVTGWYMAGLPSSIEGMLGGMCVRHGSVAA